MLSFSSQKTPCDVAPPPCIQSFHIHDIFFSPRVKILIIPWTGAQEAIGTWGDLRTQGRIHHLDKRWGTRHPSGVIAILPFVCLSQNVDMEQHAYPGMLEKKIFLLACGVSFRLIGISPPFVCCSHAGVQERL